MMLIAFVPCHTTLGGPEGVEIMQLPERMSPLHFLTLVWKSLTTIGVKRYDYV
jgi:hypothetical protein